MNDATPQYAINYQPVIGALEKLDVQQLIDDTTDPWYNQTLCQVGDTVVRLGVMQGEFHWHKHDKEDEFFFLLDGLFASNSRAWTPSSYSPGRRISSPEGTCTGPSCPCAPPYS